MDYSLQANRKTLERGQHPDRNAEFEHINERVRQHLLQGRAILKRYRAQSVISVDTKKKELVGEFKNDGREWRPKGKPEKVGVHDFPSKELGKVAPYGIYDLGRNPGWVSVGVDHDTSAFAVESIRRWWYSMGRPCYPRGRQLLITAEMPAAAMGAGATLEMGVAEAGRRNGVAHRGLPLSAGHQQVEQD